MRRGSHTLQWPLWGCTMFLSHITYIRTAALHRFLHAQHPTHSRPSSSCHVPFESRHALLYGLLRFVWPCCSLGGSPVRPPPSWHFAVTVGETGASWGWAVGWDEGSHTPKLLRLTGPNWPCLDETGGETSVHFSCKGFRPPSLCSVIKHCSSFCVFNNSTCFSLV